MCDFPSVNFFCSSISCFMTSGFVNNITPNQVPVTFEVCWPAFFFFTIFLFLFLFVFFTCLFVSSFFFFFFLCTQKQCNYQSNHFIIGQSLAACFVSDIGKCCNKIMMLTQQFFFLSLGIKKEFTNSFFFFWPIFFLLQRRLTSFYSPRSF